MGCFWGCKWEIIHVMQGEFTFLRKGAGTALLRRCVKCGAIKSDTINGHWTLEQIKGEE